MPQTRKIYEKMTILIIQQVTLNTCIKLKKKKISLIKFLFSQMFKQKNPNKVLKNVLQTNISLQKVTVFHKKISNFKAWLN